MYLVKNHSIRPSLNFPMYFSVKPHLNIAEQRFCCIDGYKCVMNTRRVMLYENWENRC